MSVYKFFCKIILCFFSKTLFGRKHCWCYDS